MVALIVLTFALLLGSSQAFKHYRLRIPNGKNVPHPCKANLKWPGVGHENRSGGGKRNAFGVDFAKFGSKWNEEICQADSDGDGWTNGYELGDPDCAWSPGQTPSRSDNITHPGESTGTIKIY
ncbi:temptin [Plakobranchus ocellatus]|uniref:Temptin n=1 Tax=Plakobranchus ocellatus TaxID=259542 RepID=A0AAV3YB92_9GAST|nr:temptin [Plakobranchus ocellatus]